MRQGKLSIYLKPVIITGIIIFRFFLPAVTVLAQLPDARITLDINNKPVREILENISLQAGYYFTYNADLFPEKEKLSLNVNNFPLQSTLDSLFHDSTLNFRLIDKNIVIYRRVPRLFSEMQNDTADFYRITGHITDTRTTKPLAYATVALYGTNKGSISNETGDFMLNIPSEIKDPLLVISFIGYQNQYYPVTLPVDKKLEISLNKDVVSLQEVIIRYQDPAGLLDEAIEKIPENYLNQGSVMTAYYRENVQRNKKFLIFSEAVIEIRKDAYTGNMTDEKVKIVKGRKFINVSDEDTVVMKIKSGIKSSLDLDIVRNIPYFMTAEDRHLYDFEFSDIVSYRNHLVYVITFRQKPQVREALYTGDIYLDMDNLAILAADFQLDPRYIRQESGTFVIKKSPHLKISPLSASYHVEYRKSDDRYHLSQVRGEVRFRMRKQKKWIASTYSLGIEMAVTDVEEGSKEKFRSSETINTGVILSDQKFTPDPAFWGDYDVIEPEASLTEVLEKMGKPQPW
jgi:hypothetical protein